MLVCAIMFLIILALETPTLLKLYAHTVMSSASDTNAIESMRQTLTTTQESCIQLTEQIAMLENLGNNWCSIYIYLAEIISIARDQLTIQQLHSDEQTLKIIGLIHQQRSVALSSLITTLSMYKNLGFTTTPAEKSGYYNFTIATREAVDGMQEPT